MILDDFLWNHAPAVVLLVSLSVFFYFVTISSRNVAVANDFSATYHSHAVWRLFSRCMFRRFGHRFQQSFFSMRCHIDFRLDQKGIEDDIEKDSKLDSLSSVGVSNDGFAIPTRIPRYLTPMLGEDRFSMIFLNSGLLGRD